MGGRMQKRAGRGPRRERPAAADPLSVRRRRVRSIGDRRSSRTAVNGTSGATSRRSRWSTTGMAIASAPRRNAGRGSHALGRRRDRSREGYRRDWGHDGTCATHVIDSFSRPSSRVAERQSPVYFPLPGRQICEAARSPAAATCRAGRSRSRHRAAPDQLQREAGQLARDKTFRIADGSATITSSALSSHETSTGRGRETSTRWDRGAGTR